MKAKQEEEVKWERWDGAYVEWLDSGSNDGWMPEHEIDFDMKECRSLGFFYHETDKAMWFVMNHDTASDDICLIIDIPKVAITKLVKVAYNGS